MTQRVCAYTDGGCRGNPGPGGWGVVLEFGEHRKELSGSATSTTNNQMELMAAIQALEALSRHCAVDLYTDSTYVQKGMKEWLANWRRRGWKTAAGKPVKNAELWKRLDAAAKQHQVAWHWVKGHAGHPGNEAADRLANAAMDAMAAGAV